jgi:hypothetical protein
MNKATIMLAAGMLFLLAACKKELVGIKSDDRNAYIQELEFDYFDANSKIRYQEGDKQVTGNAKIRIRKDSVIWFSVSPTLGFEVTRALITPDTIWILNRMDKEFYVFNYKEISRYFNFSVDYYLLQSMLLGNLPRPLTEAARVAKDNEYFMIKQGDGKIDIESFVNSGNKKLETVVMKQAASNNTLMLSYEDFKETSLHLFPYLCQVSLKYSTNQGPMVTTLRLEHHRAEISEKPLKFPFTIPKKYDIFE